MSPKRGTSDRARDGNNKGANIRIVSQPPTGSLGPTEQTKKELRHLLNWERRSEKRDWIIGHPCS